MDPCGAGRRLPPSSAPPASPPSSRLLPPAEPHAIGVQILAVQQDACPQKYAHRSTKPSLPCAIEEPGRRKGSDPAKVTPHGAAGAELTSPQRLCPQPAPGSALPTSAERRARRKLREPHPQSGHHKAGGEEAASLLLQPRHLTLRAAFPEGWRRGARARLPRHGARLKARPWVPHPEAGRDRL